MGTNPRQGNGLCKGTEVGKSTELEQLLWEASTARKGQVGLDGTAEKGGGQDGQPPQAMLEITIFIITSMSRQGAVLSQVSSGRSAFLLTQEKCEGCEGRTWCPSRPPLQAGSSAEAVPLQRVLSWCSD